MGVPLACITPELPLSKVTPGETFTRVGEISMMDSKYPFSMLATSFGVPIVNCSLIALSFLPLNVYQTCKLSDLHYGTNRAFHMVQTILKCTCGIFCLPICIKTQGRNVFLLLNQVIGSLLLMGDGLASLQLALSMHPHARISLLLMLQVVAKCLHY